MALLAPTQHARGQLDPGAGVVRYRNVRYAVGGRGSPPVPVPLRDVTDDGEAPDHLSARLACPQPRYPQADLASLYADLTYTEDCQVLSVTVPASRTASQLLPVMVWIHGGSYLTGAGDLAIYDSAPLAREGGVVVVNLTYRLGPFGFLGGGDRSANLGLLDLVAAMQWVRANIAAFGGDPDQVTVFGQSAGADAAAHLMIAAGAEGTFRRVILQSAPWGVRGRREELQRRVAKAVGQIPPGASSEEIVALASVVIRAALGAGLRAGMPFAPQYGAAPLPTEREAAARWRAAGQEIDVLLGWTREEAAFFAGSLPKPLVRWLVESPVGTWVRHQVVRAVTDAVYRTPGAAFAEGLGDAVVGRYQVDWVPPGARGGAMHAIELPLLFPDPDAWRGATMLGTIDTHTLASVGAPMRAAWTAFARGEGLPATDVELPDGGGGVAFTHRR